MEEVASPELLELVLQTLSDLQDSLQLPKDPKPCARTRIYGGEYGLDSIQLVMLIADLEGAIQARYGVSPVLADERAMSRTLSPFLRAGTLAEYIGERISQSRGASPN